MTQETVSSLIDALGGNVVVGRLTASAPKTVSSWRNRNRLPAKTFPVLHPELVRLGFYAPLHLWGIQLPARRKRTA